MLNFKLLLLVVVANGAPVLAWDLLRDRYARPVDAGRRFYDGRPWLGASKTWRGLIASLAMTTATAPLLGLPWHTGLMIALAAMAGDLLSSFSKRRLGIETSARAMGLDQIPESLLPLLVVKDRYGLRWEDIVLLVALFFILEVTISPLLYHLGIRKRPY
ncbi:MAG TPA: CDP-archaeol synthase [Methylothermaceae bacterium]|nr:CDP-archaeol synthase [Methylothermaceae bacterium]